MSQLCIPTQERGNDRILTPLVIPAKAGIHSSLVGWISEAHPPFYLRTFLLACMVDKSLDASTVLSKKQCHSARSRRILLNHFHFIKKIPFCAQFKKLYKFIAEKKSYARKKTFFSSFHLFSYQDL